MTQTSLSCHYIGHATTFIHINNHIIATDPHFGNRVLTQKRQSPLGIHPCDIPSVNAVLISHVHFDHFHMPSFKYIDCNTPIIAPEGCAKLIQSFIPNPVIEMNHFSNQDIGNMTITAVPVKHHSFRILPWNYTHSNAYLIKSNNHTVYFCGDSAYGSHFKKAADLANIDLALLPIGSYTPNFLLKFNHMTPEDAYLAFKDLHAKHMIPIHHSTFKLSLENSREPRQRLMNRLAAEPKEVYNQVHILESGDHWKLES